MTLLCGDCVQQMKNLPGESVDLCVTSPPYDNLRTYGGMVWDFEQTAHQLMRILKRGGVVCWNVGDAVVSKSETLSSFKQAIYFKEQVGFLVHDTMIWQKTHVACPCSTRYHQMFEYVFVISKGVPKTFNPIEDRKNKWGGKAPFSYNSKRLVDGSIKKTRERSGRGVIKEYGKRHNVWTGNSRAQEEPCKTLSHPAMMPKWLARDLILSWSNVGDTVLDPFAGSGTTGEAAIATGRNAILIELNPEYTAHISHRLNLNKAA